MKGQLTHCRNGHPYTDENTIWHAEGTKSCRVCRRESLRRRREWKKNPMRQLICPTCGARVDMEQQHADWHEQLEARLTLLEAHSENLIERTYALEGGDASR